MVRSRKEETQRCCPPCFSKNPKNRCFLLFLSLKNHSVVRWRTALLFKNCRSVVTCRSVVKEPMLLLVLLLKNRCFFLFCCVFRWKEEPLFVQEEQGLKKRSAIQEETDSGITSFSLLVSNEERFFNNRRRAVLQIAVLMKRTIPLFFLKEKNKKLERFLWFCLFWNTPSKESANNRTRRSSR